MSQAPNTLKITYAQLNPMVGDLAGNLKMLANAADKAVADGATLLVCPELSLTGYYPGDLLDEPAFLTATELAFSALREESAKRPSLYWVAGLPLVAEGPGKRLNNSLVILKAGDVVATYSKQLLPTYNIFDERRHFEPGAKAAPVVSIGQARVGFLICEDGWNDSKQDYAVNPFEQLQQQAPDLVVSINASPSNIGKREQRHELFTQASANRQFPILYVNQVGGQDQLVFDGASFAVEPSRGVVFEAQRFVEDVRTLTFDLDLRTFTAQEGLALPAVSKEGLSVMEFYRQQIVLGLRDYTRRCGFSKVVVGSSGGIDSALTIALAVEALGAENVLAITMPSRFSSEGSVSDSAALCQGLGVTLLEHPIIDIVGAYSAGFKQSSGQELQGLAQENLQARIRGTILMEYSNSFGHMLLTTGNKSEISVGYCTLYGDTNGGLGLIGDLYKTEVFALCRHLNETAGREIIPWAIIDKPPSAELAPGQKDTDSLPPYELLDAVLKLLIEGNRLGAEELKAAKVCVDDLMQTVEGRGLVSKVKGMIARNEYKRRQSPPHLRVRARAFGSGRQMPIAAKHTF